MREEICTSQDLDTRETQRLSSARLQQLPLDSVSRNPGVLNMRYAPSVALSCNYDDVTVAAQTTASYIYHQNPAIAVRAVTNS